MTRFTLTVNEYVQSVLADLCGIQGSHLTITIINGEVCLASICPEYFKIYRTRQMIDVEVSAIRIPKKLLKPFIAEECVLMFTLDNKVVIRKFKENQALKASITLPLEFDFNDAFITNAVMHEESAERYDLAPILGMRALVPFSSTGIQFKDNLAYIHGQGFIAYREINHPINFILTQKNISELLKFVKLHGSVQIFEQENYIVFRNGNYLFGCRQPVNFVDSEYSSYKMSKPIHEVKLPLTELCTIFRSLVIPKGSNLTCQFNLGQCRAGVHYSADCNYVIGLENEPVEYSFGLSVDVLKQIFANSHLDYTDVTLLVFESFVTFRFGDLDILISRYD